MLSLFVFNEGLEIELRCSCLQGKHFADSFERGSQGGLVEEVAFEQRLRKVRKGAVEPQQKECSHEADAPGLTGQQGARSGGDLGSRGRHRV